MNMSRAALPPIQPPMPQGKDREHPDFPAYLAYRSGCNRLLIEASAFSDWLFQRRAEAEREEWCSHPRYIEFVDWMRANQGGADRKGNPGRFPDNFKAWLDGVRW